MNAQVVDSEDEDMHNIIVTRSVTKPADAATPTKKTTLVQRVLFEVSVT